MQNKIFSIDPEAHTAQCDPRDPSFFQNPYAFYAQLHAQMTRFRWTDYGHWCFAAFDDVSALLRDRRFGRQILHVASREELGLPAPKPHLADFDAADAHSLLYLEPPEHTRLRTLVNRAFVSRHVEKLRPRIAQLSNELIDSFEAEREVELIESFAAPIPVIVIAEMLGVPTHMAPQLLDWSHRMVRMYMFGVTEAVEHDANTAAREFADYVRDLAAGKRAAPGDDLISYMISTEHQGQRLTEDELISTTILLLNAGHEATVHQTGNAVKSILESGLDTAAIFATQAGAAAVVEEALRFDAPLHMFTRYALEDMTIFERIHLRKGDTIGLMLGAANRDPRRFQNADTFAPTRPDQANVSFSAGIHFCIGAPLARIEMQVALKVLFDRLPGLRIATAPSYRDAYHFHGLERLQVSW